MDEIKKILVPVDFSGHTQEALKVAEVISAKAKAEIMLLHVIEFPHAPKFSSTADLIYQDELLDNYLKKLSEAAHARLQELAAPLTVSGRKVSFKVSVDKVYNVVSATVLDESIDLLVCGIRGEESESELGSNAEKFVRRLKIPVITVDTVPLDYSLNKVLFASLFSAEERKLFDKVKTIAAVLSCSLSAVRINSPKEYLSPVEETQLIDQLKEEYEPDPDVEIFSDVSEEDGIIRFAAEVNADMIVIGTHGREGIFHFLRGSIAEDVAGMSQRPVMTLHIK